MKRRALGAPQVATTALMAFTTGAFYIAGGTAAALSTLPTSAALDAPTSALLTLATTAVLGGFALLGWGWRLPRWAFHGVVGAASAMLAAGVVLSDDQSAAVLVAGVFVFCAVDILYFFHGRQALAQTLVLLSAVATSLTARGTHPAHTAAVLLIQIAVIVVIGRLVTRAAEGGKDALTGLANRRTFDEHLTGAVTSAVRTRTALAVALVDVDHFKAVNDTSGHSGGDALLRALAVAWSAALPAGMLLARQGGDEFALLAPGCSAAELAHVCEQLHALAAPTTISVGITALSPGEDGSSVLRHADGALYAAKAAGRARTRTTTDAARVAPHAAV